MVKARTPREAWIEAGLRALAAGGPDSVRIEVLARDLGVSKGGFYWHFEHRPQLLDELLGAWEQRLVDDVITAVEEQAGDARSKLRHLFALASSTDLRTELAVRQWARREKHVARQLRSVDNRRMHYMRALFSQICADAGDVEARCLLAMALFIGSPLIDVDHGSRSRAEVMTTATLQLLS